MKGSRVLLLTLLILSLSTACGGTYPTANETTIAQIEETVVAKILTDYPPMPPESVVLTAIAQTQAVQTAIAFIQTDTPQPTSTLTPTVTTVTLTPTVASSSEDYFAWNYLTSQESGGLKVEIARVVLADTNIINLDWSRWYPVGLTLPSLSSPTPFSLTENYSVLAEIIFVITNSTDNAIVLDKYSGVVVEGSTHVDWFSFFGTPDEFLPIKVLPHTTFITFIWFGLKTPISQIEKLIYYCDGPHDSDGNRLGRDFYIVIDLSERKNEPKPIELGDIDDPLSLGKK